MSDEFQYRLREFEAQPPTKSWEKIEAALDEASLAFPQKLFQYETEPASTLWNRIEMGLTPVPQTRVIPFYRRPKVLQYAGIAATLIGLVVLGFIYTEKKPGSDISSQTLVVTPVVPVKEVATGKDSEQNPDVNQTNTDEPAAVVQKREKPAALYSSTFRERAARVDDLPDPSPHSDLLAYQELPDNFVIYTDGDGNTTRLPKKLFEAFDCATKEIICRQKIRDLQNRMTSSAVSSDFPGLLEILRNLQENQ